MTRRSRGKRPYPPPAGVAPAGRDRPKLAAAVELGHLGGLKGGPARARKLSAKRRSQIARKAALARWRVRRPYW
jgi:hypothetical protein